MLILLLFFLAVFNFLLFKFEIIVYLVLYESFPIDIKYEVIEKNWRYCVHVLYVIMCLKQIQFSS